MFINIFLYFQKDLFCRVVSSSSIRMFLEWFCETQLFEIFITNKLEHGVPTSGLFETRVVEYREEMDKFSLRLRNNFKNLGQKMKNFGGKLMGAFSGTPSVYL